MGPLIGYNILLPREKPGEIINDILRVEGIHPKIFMQKDRRITSKGRLRKIQFYPYHLKTQLHILPPEDIVVNLIFRLEKGIYATILLREFMKESVKI